MVTNIDLSSEEQAPSDHKFGGKSALIFSAVLIVVAILAQLALNYLKNDYAGKEQLMQSELASKKAAMIGSSYADLVDFQERLNFIDAAIGSRTDWDAFLKEFSKYIAPEVKLNSLAYDSKIGELSLDAVAPNIETVAKEVVLLKKFPRTDSIEFGGATESLNITDSSQKTSFNVKIKIRGNE